MSSSKKFDCESSSSDRSAAREFVSVYISALAASTERFSVEYSKSESGGEVVIKALPSKPKDSSPKSKASKGRRSSGDQPEGNPKD